MISCKVRYISRQPSGSVSRKEQLTQSASHRLKLGRGTDADIFLKDLRISYHHAEIVVRDLDVIIEAVGESPIRLDGVLTSRGVLTPETEVEIGPYRVSLAPAGPDADLALEVELVTSLAAETIDKLLLPKRQTLQSVIPGKRPLAWMLFLVVLMVSLALPILAFLSKPPPPLGRIQAATSTTPRFARLDQLWNPGELAASHKFLIGHCEACHDKAFQLVRSAACGVCHMGMRGHFDTAQFHFDDLRSPRFQLAAFEPTRCTGCHDEHKGPDGNLPVQQSLCGGCHTDLSHRPGKSMLLDVVDFGTDHPEFRVSVVVDPASGRIERAELGTPGLPAEKSGLKFSHLTHLARICEKPPAQDAKALASWPEEKTDACLVIQDARTRLRKPNLECADCHVPDPSGVDLRPVDMRVNCSVCHTLQFDKSAPERVLPHGQPDEVIAVVQDYYAARASRGQAVVQPPPTDTRRRAGMASPTASVSPAVSRKLEAVNVSGQRLDDIFGRSICGECHLVVPPARSARSKWEVLPVRMTEHWLPKAHFNHAAHATSACTSCHKARDSRVSEDVLMPSIETCRSCHGGEKAVSLVPSTCTMCHVYHREDAALIVPGPRQAGVSGGSTAGSPETR